MNDYDEIAIWYDLLLGKWDRTVDRYISFLKEILWVDFKGCALDVACGTGIYLAALDALFNRSIGIDISERMLDVAKNNLQSLGERVKLLRASWFDLPLSDGGVNAVLCMGNSLAHCLGDEALRRVMLEFRRVVGDGQIVVDCRNISRSMRERELRERGRGVVNGQFCAIYDSWEFLSDGTYQITLVVRICAAHGDTEICRTILRYRHNLKETVILMCPQLDLKVDKCIQVKDLGDIFDVILLSSR